MFIDLGAVFVVITVIVMLVWEVVQFINEPEVKTAKCAFKQDFEIRKLFIIENGNITRIR